MTYRCAVYTRKSHEEGLDQDFNSLDAQYEACSAYIASQAGLGWTLRDKRYDDGGISGGHINRPALQELIGDIKAGLVDVIVVYKVDRLTRSLTDFAKLVDVFDAHDVSFVSVTQAFNTTTSMGRLTLNVLLSFAQFEREVTAERIRDKFAASKAKGIWMGGTCPIGYRHQDRKLYIREDEAAIVRTLFQLYLGHRNVTKVKAEADRLGFLSRQRTQRCGKIAGGKPLSRGLIYRILKNPIYIGKIQHKDKLYEGQHEAIIELNIWDAVQAQLNKHTSKRKAYHNSKSPALLSGLLFDDAGNKLVTHSTRNHGRTYHYYVAQKLRTGDEDSGWRIPIKTIDPILINELKSILSSKEALLELLGIQTPSAHLLQTLVNQGQELSITIKGADHQYLKDLLNKLIDKIILTPNCLNITFKPQGLAKHFDIELPEKSNITISKPMTIRRRGQEMKMVIGGLESKPSNPDNALIKLIAKAHLLKAELEDGTIDSIKTFAAKHKIDHGDAKNLIPLSYLAPSIVEDILSGHQPTDLTARRLKYLSNLPTGWADQRQFLGFN